MRTKIKVYVILLAVMAVACAAKSTVTTTNTNKQVQTTNPECPQNLSIFVEFAKVENYEAAYESLQKLRKDCPDFHYAIYAYGEKTLMYKIKNSKGSEKTGFINSLMKLHDESIQYFPERFTPGKVVAYKAILMFDEKLAGDEELYNMLDEAFKKDRANFKNAKAIYLYFSALVNLHNSGKKELQDVFDAYDDVTERIDEEKKELLVIIDKLLPEEEAGTLNRKEALKLGNARKNAEIFDQISASIDGKLGKLADCDKLIPLYTANFPSKKNDAVWLKRAANRMDSKECSDDPLFIQIVEALHRLDPSAKSAYYLGFLNDKNGKSSEAIKYYNESLTLETDTYEKAKTAMKIAHKYKSRDQKSTARNYARKALGYQPSMGSAYLLIASLYANSANQCGATAFEKRAIYWLASDTASKAGQVDSSLKAAAAAAVESYRSRAPSKTEIFNADMGGKTIQFKCWVQESITVPKL